MSKVSDEIMAEAIKEVQREIENEADRVRRQLVRATKEAMGDYYKYPRGRYYDRTGDFGRAYTSFKEQDFKDPNNMSVTVGISFEDDNAPEYEHHGIPNEAIYAANLAGEHGGQGRGNSGDVIEHVERVADFIVAK